MSEIVAITPLAPGIWLNGELPVVALVTLDNGDVVTGVLDFQGRVIPLWGDGRKYTFSGAWSQPES